MPFGTIACRNAESQKIIRMKFCVEYHVHDSGGVFLQFVICESCQHWHSMVATIELQIIEKLDWRRVNWERILLWHELAMINWNNAFRIARPPTTRSRKNLYADNRRWPWDKLEFWTMFSGIQSIRYIKIIRFYSFDISLPDDGVIQNLNDDVQTMKFLAQVIKNYSPNRQTGRQTNTIENTRKCGQ